MLTIERVAQWTPGEVLSAVTRLADEGRQRTADLITLLAAVPEEQLYAPAGYPSLFRFCVGRLRLSEEEAFCRIAAARVARRVPGVLERLRDGRLTLTAVTLLRKHLTEENQETVLASAEGLSRREVEALVAALAPQPDVRTSVRKVPVPAVVYRGGTADARLKRATEDRAAGLRQASAECGHRRAETPPAAATPPHLGPRGFDLPPRQDGPVRTSPAAIEARREEPRDERAAAVSEQAMPVPAVTSRWAEVRPLSPTRYSLRLTISEETHAKLRRAHDLLAHTVAPGDTAAVLDQALSVLLAQLERRRFAARQPRPLSPSPEHPSAERPVARAASPTTTPAPPDPGRLNAPPPGPLASKWPARRGRSRYIPADVRREVWQRDGGRCSFVGENGRCDETSRLEFHHRVPFADGGEAIASNLCLRCTGHHGWEGQRWFGDEGSRYRQPKWQGEEAAGGTRSEPS